jgi:hypothetical protein
MPYVAITVPTAPVDVGMICSVPVAAPVCLPTGDLEAGATVLDVRRNRKDEGIILRMIDPRSGNIYAVIIDTPEVH